MSNDIDNFLSQFGEQLKEKIEKETDRQMDDLRHHFDQISAIIRSRLSIYTEEGGYFWTEMASGIMRNVSTPEEFQDESDTKQHCLVKTVHALKLLVAQEVRNSYRADVIKMVLNSIALPEVLSVSPSIGVLNPTSKDSP